MDKLMNGIEYILKGAVLTLIGAMMVWVCGMVPARYLFNYTPSYGEELSRYMFVWLVFLSLPIVAKAGGHMAIETVTICLKGSALKTARIIAEAFTLIFLAIMTYQGIFMVMRASYQTSPGLGLSMSVVYLAIPIGCGIMFLNVLAHFSKLLRMPADDVK